MVRPPRTRTLANSESKRLWVQQPQSMFINRYSYVGNDPVNLVDPLGLYCALWENDLLLGHDSGDVVWQSDWFCAVEIPDGGGGFGGSEQASKAFSKAMAKQCDPKDVKK